MTAEDSGGGGWLLRGGMFNPVSCEKLQHRKQQGEEKALLPQDLFNQKHQEEYAQSQLGKSGSYCRADGACKKVKVATRACGVMPCWEQEIPGGAEGHGQMGG